MSRKIRKLTPELLKKLIKEEKQKLAIKKNRKKPRQKKSSAGIELKMLRESRKKQVELVRKFKKLHMLRRKLKKNLIKRL